MTNLFEIQTCICVCSGEVRVVWLWVLFWGMGFFVCFCFSAVLFACHTYLRSQGLFFWEESKLPKLLATDLCFMHSILAWPADIFPI